MTTAEINDFNLNPEQKADSLADWLEELADEIRRRGILDVELSCAQSMIEYSRRPDSPKEYRPGGERALSLRFYFQDVRRPGPSEREWPALAIFKQQGVDGTLASWSQRIRCPKCDSVEEAVVEHHEGEPWPRFAHKCGVCGYTIMESEWDRVDE